MVSGPSGAGSSSQRKPCLFAVEGDALDQSRESLLGRRRWGGVHAPSQLAWRQDPVISRSRHFHQTVAVRILRKILSCACSWRTQKANVLGGRRTVKQSISSESWQRGKNLFCFHRLHKVEQADRNWGHRARMITNCLGNQNRTLRCFIADHPRLPPISRCASRSAC